jgi:hypothetical protein
MNRRRLFARFAMALGMAASLGAHAQSQESITAARLVAQAWLAEVDAGRYGESWGHASSAFQAGVSKARW